MSRYPRTCRNGHTIAGPDDEADAGRGYRSCRECARAAWRRYNKSDAGVGRHARVMRKRIESGKHAEVAARYRRQLADELDAPIGKLRAL